MLRDHASHASPCARGSAQTTDTRRIGDSSSLVHLNTSDSQGREMDHTAAYMVKQRKPSFIYGPPLEDDPTVCHVVIGPEISSRIIGFLTK